MSQKPPFTGTGHEQDAADLPPGDTLTNHDNLDSVSSNWPTRPTRSTRPNLISPTKPNDRASRAISDAQEGLSSLLKPQGSKGQDRETGPQIISPSGATRNQTHGRVAGPTATPITRVTRPHNIEALSGYLTSGSNQNAGTALSLTVDGYDDPDEIRAVPQTRLDRGVARGKEQIEVIRQRASLLVAPGDGISASVDESVEMQDTRRAAARWATRYATHIVIVLVVGLMVAVGGIAGFTQGNSSTAHSDDPELGTDHIEADHDVATGKPDLDSQNFDLTLPRTELNGAVSKDPGTGAGNTDGSQPANTQPIGAVTKYVVIKGDTIASVAKAFHVMPETVMGSNGIFDADQDLTPGDALNIPPIDGMYYVPAEGDSVESIAQDFGVAPEVVSSYAPNKIAADGVKPGQALVVPGGMMPSREVVLIYTVKPGDTLRAIAARFGVDVPTMINSNDIPDPDSLQIDSELRVLPVAGIEYKVKKGDTVRDIADRLGVSAQMIIDYSPNRLGASSVLQIDQKLMIPGGKPERKPEPAVAVRPQTQSKTSTQSSSSSSSSSKSTTSSSTKSSTTSSTTKSSANVQKTKPKVEAPVKPKPATVKTVTKPVASTTKNTPKVGTGRMMWPVQGRITQYFSSRHNGLDIAIAAGTPLHAADSGRVIWSGWRTDGLGNCVMIDHGNGITTIYGHMIRRPPVYVGQYVSKGAIIGHIGSTGRSTGPHVHFMVKVGSGRNYRNPLAYLSGR